MFFSALSGSLPDPRKYKQPDVVTTDGISWTDRMTRKTCFSFARHTRTFLREECRGGRETAAASGQGQ